MRAFLSIGAGGHPGDPRLERYDKARGNGCWMDIHSVSPVLVSPLPFE